MTNPLLKAFDDLAGMADTSTPTLGGLLDRLQRRGFGSVWLVLAFVSVTPLAAIPGVPALVGLVLAVFSVQMVMGFQRPWLPDRLMKVDVTQKRIDQFLKYAVPITTKLSKFIYPRLTFMALGVVPSLVLAIAAILIGLTMIVLGFLPFAPFILGLPFFLLALAFTAEDGLLMIIGYALLAVAGWGIYYLFQGGA